MIKSPISYPGGKFKAMPQIMPHIPYNIKDWREPFFGGGSVTLYYLQECLNGALDDNGKVREVPKSITVGDLNPEIYNLWVGCRDYAADAITECVKIMGERVKYYYPMFSDVNIMCADYIKSEKFSEVIDSYNKNVCAVLATQLAYNKSECINNCKNLILSHGLTEGAFDLNEMIDCIVIHRDNEEELDAYVKEKGQDTYYASALKDLANTIVKEAKDTFDYLKNMETKDLSCARRCARQYLVNKISFSGMGDAGSVSKDQFMSFKLSQAKRLMSVGSVLQGVDIKNVSFEEIMRLEPMGGATADEVYIFLDPPYLTQESSGLYGKNGEMHHGFPHQLFVDECKKTKYKFLVTYDDSVQVRKMFKGLEMLPFKLTYTMAGKTSNDALAGEELFIANFALEDKDTDDCFEI